MFIFIFRVVTALWSLRLKCLIWLPETQLEMFWGHLEGPILSCLSSVSHSCQRSNNSVFDMHCPKPMRGPEFQLSRSGSADLHSEQSVSVPAPLNANELRLSKLTWRALPATSLSGSGSPLC